MNIAEKTPVLVVAATLPGATEIFDALGIDYSSPGERSIGEAAGLEGVDADEVVRQLRRLSPADGRRSWLDRTLKDLIEHLIEQHRRFTRDDLARVAEQLAEVCSESSPATDAVKRLREEFKILASELLPHIHREEGELFPLIERVEALWNSNEPAPASLQENIKQTVKDLLVEHGAISAHLRAVREIRIDAESQDLLPNCRRALQSVSKLECDLRQYMFLENCILFPRAVAMLNSLVSGVTKER